MKVQRRDFILFVALAAAAATPALAQRCRPRFRQLAVLPKALHRSRISRASGAHPYFPGFEPPASGPGPVVNRSRRRDGVGNANQFVGDYTNPILKPQAADVVKKHGEISLRARPIRPRAISVGPSGVPYIFFQHRLQMLQLPEKVIFLYLRNHEFRDVRLNEPHPAHVTPSWYGDSVGRYEGDTLVIDTVGVKAGPFAMVDMYGTPFSPALHVVERYRLSIMPCKRGDRTQRQGEYSFWSDGPIVGIRSRLSRQTPATSVYS